MRVEPLAVPEAGRAVQKTWHLADTHHTLAVALHELKDPGAAEIAVRAAMKHRDLLPWHSLLDDLNKYEDHVLLAIILARQGRLAQARETIEPVLAFHRKLPAYAAADLFRELQRAQALYAAALASPAQAPGLLAEAARIIDAFPPETRRRNTVSRVRGWIAEAMAKRP